MKILHLTPVYEPAWSAGGVVRAVSQLCRGLGALGFDVTVYTTDSGGAPRLDVPINQPVEVGGVRVFYFHSESPRMFRYSRAMGVACRETLGDFDLVHMAAFWNYPGICAGLECRRHKVPYVISPHGTLEAGELRRKRLKKWLYMRFVEDRNLRGAAAIHYTTELERESTDQLKLQVPSFVVPNGLDCQEFDHLPTRSDARARLELLHDDLVVTYLGRLHPRKALDVLVKAFAQLSQRLPCVRLLLAGPDYGHEGELRKLMQCLGLGLHVRFLGHVDPETRASLLAATDLVVLAPWPGENFGYAAVEAMAAGVPVLVSDHVGICRQIEVDGAGRVVPVEAEAIATELLRLLSEPASLTGMGRAAYLSVRKRYGIELIARRMARAYEDILTGRRSPECQWSGESTQ